MASIIENLNSVITTKNQLNTILKENGQPGSEVFSEYPEQFRAAIAGAGTSEEAVNSYISSYLDTYNYINSDSLSAYNFIDADELNGMSYITMGDVSNCGYITASDIPEVDLSSYVTYDYLSAQGYVTSVPAIDENLIPKENDTYTLGDTSNYYHTTYTNRVRGSSSVNFVAGGNNRVTVTGTAFRPMQQNYNLGSSDYPFAYTYTNYLYLGASYIYSDEYAIDFKVNGNTTARLFSSSFRPWVDNGVTLGASSTRWSTTYTSNIYADNAYISNIHNFIWTGTSAEYAALDNYTSYQIYMIKES